MLSKSVLDGSRVPGTAATTFDVYCSWLDNFVRTADGWRIKERTLKVIASSGDSQVWDSETIAGQAFRRLTGDVSAVH